MTVYEKNFTPFETTIVEASMLEDGALRLVVRTDNYNTLMEFLLDDGPKNATWTVNYAIQSGLCTDQGVINFYKSKAEVKVIEFDVQRSDGVKLVDDRPIS